MRHFSVHLFLLALVASCGSTSPRWSLAESRCRAASNMVYSGDLETIYGRLQRVVEAAYPEYSHDPLLRTIRTDWHAVPLEHHEVSKWQGKPIDLVTRYEMRFTISLPGEGPFRVMVDSEARWHKVVELDKTVTIKAGRMDSTLPEFELQLKEAIRTGLTEFAAHCAGDMIRPNCDPRPAGEPSSFTRPDELPDNVEVADPLLCARGSAYVRVSRLEGRRQLAVEREHGTSGAFQSGCREMPHDAAGDSCSSINVLTVLQTIARALKREGITVSGTGLGPCADGVGDYSHWNMSLGVFDWGDVPRAVQMVALVMDEYDLSGCVGVAVRGRGEYCGVSGTVEQGH